ncbi:MAG: pilus assembly protein PilM [Vulcanimicrobiaceae bacterium]
MGRGHALPLGVDIGGKRLRIAFAERIRGGEREMRAVVSRDLPNDSVSSTGEILQPDIVAVMIEQAVCELGTRERRCVASVHDQALRMITFPGMGGRERTRAARFEAARFSGWNFEEEPTSVRAHRVGDSLYAIGAVRSAVLASRVRTLRAAGLRPLAIDSETFALRRALAGFDVIIDVGWERTTVHLPLGEGQCTFSMQNGGAHITRGIALDLAIDEIAAETRKRIVGLAGAGTIQRDEALSEIVRTIERYKNRAPVARVAMTGNGARLAGFCSSLERALHASVHIPVPDALQCDIYPNDVLEVAAPDWAHAVGLAQWYAA